MDRDTYWLLDAVVSSYRPLRMIALEYNVGYVLNKPWHGMDEKQLVQALHTAFTEGDLVALVIENGMQGDFFVPTMHDLRAATERIGNLYYGLTPQGGARWEQASAPRWDLFVEYYYNLEVGEITATTRELAHRYLATQPYDGIGIVEGSEHWQVLTPWPATYWKSLPIGHMVSFRCVERTEEQPEPTPAWVDELTQETSSWYTNVWQQLR